MAMTATKKSYKNKIKKIKNYKIKKYVNIHQEKNLAIPKKLTYSELILTLTFKYNVLTVFQS